MENTNVFCQKRQFSNDHKKSFIAPIDLIFCILASLFMENPNLKSTFSWDLLEILTLANQLLSVNFKFSLARACRSLKRNGELPGGNSTLIRRVCATGVLNLSPCSGVDKPKKYTFFWSYHRSFLKSIVLYCIVSYCIVLYCIVLYCIVLYCIVLYCIVLYCIVLYCIGDKDHDHVYALLL